MILPESDNCSHPHGLTEGVFPTVETLEMLLVAGKNNNNQTKRGDVTLQQRKMFLERATHCYNEKSYKMLHRVTKVDNA